MYDKRAASSDRLLRLSDLTDLPLGVETFIPQINMQNTREEYRMMILRKNCTCV